MPEITGLWWWSTHSNSPGLGSWDPQASPLPSSPNPTRVGNSPASLSYQYIANIIHIMKGRVRWEQHKPEIISSRARVSMEAMGQASSREEELLHIYLQSFPQKQKPLGSRSPLTWVTNTKAEGDNSDHKKLAEQAWGPIRKLVRC